MKRGPRRSVLLIAGGLLFFGTSIPVYALLFAPTSQAEDVFVGTVVGLITAVFVTEGMCHFFLARRK